MKFEIVPGRTWSQSTDGTLTIHSSEGQGTWQLNRSAAAVWSVFNEPRSLDEAAELLSGNFEKYSKKDFDEVVAGTLPMLREYELVRPCIDCIIEELDKSHFPAPEIAFDGDGSLQSGPQVACNCNLPEP